MAPVFQSTLYEKGACSMKPIWLQSLVPSPTLSTSPVGLRLMALNRLRENPTLYGKA